jgi:PAS domain S-box-containing protein
MKSEVTAEPNESIAAVASHRGQGELNPRAEACPTADDGESAAKFLFKLSHDAILSLDRVGNILCINQRGVQLSGYSESELRGANVFELLLFPEDRQVARAMLADMLAGKAREYEVRWKTKDGAVIHFDGATVPRLSDAGEFLSTLCTLRDVTERKRTEERLRKSEEKYRDLIEISPDAIYVVDANGVCVLGNRAGAELAGVPQDELIGTPVTDTYLPEERHLFGERLKKLEGKSALRFERKFVRKSGEIVPVEVSVSPIRGGYFQAILRDISERKRAEEELSREQQRFMDIVDSVEGIVWEADAESFVFSFVSKQAERILGYPVEEWLQQPTFWKDHLHPEDRDWAVQFCAKATAEKHSHDFEYRMIAADGRVVWFRDLVTVVVEGDHARRLRGVMVDMTQRKRTESLLAAEKRLLEMIATGVALKDILNALCLAIEEYQVGTLASVLLLDPDGIHLKSVAGPNLPNSWTQQMEKLPIGPCAGSCGTAAYRKSPVIVSDIAADPLWDVPEHRASALKHGLRASWSNPVLSSEGKVLATFCMYYRETRNPNSQDLELIELATHLVRVAIERDRAAKALRASEQVARGQVEALTYSLDVLATAPAPDKFLGQMLSTIGRLLNAQSVILWLLDETNDSLVLRAWAEGTNFAKADPEHPFIKNSLSWKEDPGLRELFFSGAPVACEDVEHDPFTSKDLREYLKAGGTKKFLRIPTLVGGRVKGFIGIRHGDRPPYRPEEIELAQALAHQAMLAIQLNEFAERSRQAAVLEERNRMARDIHDTLAQGFTGVIVQLEAADDAIACCRRNEANEHLQRASELARRSLTEARRSVRALRPQALQQENFWEALRGIIKTTTAGTTVHTTFTLRGELRDLPHHWQENLLHIGQEALTNALKYAHSRNFETLLSFNTNELCLEFRDDGDGFDLEEQHDGFGLAGMRERSEQMGGTLNIISARGKGTKIAVTLPHNHESTPARDGGFQAVGTVRA